MGCSTGLKKDICGVYNYEKGSWKVSPKTLQYKTFGFHEQKKGTVDLRYVELLNDKLKVDIYRDDQFLSILASEKDKKSLKAVAGLTQKGNDPVQLEIQKHKLAILCNATDGPYNLQRK